MELTELARKQKRAIDWEQFLKAQVDSGPIRTSTGQALHQYRQILARCFESSQISMADQSQLENLERQLEELNERARLVVAKSVLPTPHSK
jgi:hypothetical protein